jgi:hypothetical protein
MSWRMRQRLRRLLTGSIRTRRQALRRFTACCLRVRARPRGFFVGMTVSTWSSVNARKPPSWSHRLPAGQGYGGQRPCASRGHGPPRSHSASGL